LLFETYVCLNQLKSNPDRFPLGFVCILLFIANNCLLADLIKCIEVN
jgi:hypothetical protein